MSTNLQKPLPDFIKDQGFSSFEEIYINLKDPFMHFAKQYPLNSTQLEDVYQDAFVVLYEKICSGKLTQLSSSVKTYLFSIGRYIIMNVMRKNKKEVIQEHDINLPDIEIDALQNMILTERQQMILRYINRMGSSCQKILTYFYYHQLTIPEIRKIMQYNSENVTKSKKSQCLKTLKKSIQANAV